MLDRCGLYAIYEKSNISENDAPNFIGTSTSLKILAGVHLEIVRDLANQKTTIYTCTPSLRMAPRKEKSEKATADQGDQQH